MKLIPNWRNENLICPFCGSNKSVKYFVTLAIGEKDVDVPCCNKCALERSKTNE